MARLRQHNEYFRPVSLGNRKSCPECGEKLLPGESIYSWGNYIRAKWHTVSHFCKCCFPKIKAHLEAHTAECGCVVNIVPYHCSLPSWLTIESSCPVSEGTHHAE